MSALLRLVRWLAELPGLRRLTEVGALMRVSFSLRASLVREPARFVRNELRPGEGVLATYTLRESGVAVAIRHKSPDVLILDELFSQHEYVLPDEIRTRLAASSPVQVVDLGANIGLFGAWVLGRFPDAHIVALEPEPSNARVHRVAITANGLAERWQLVEAAAATSPGRLRFAAAFSTSHVAAGEEEALDVEAVDVFPLLEAADLVKIDIEGAEWPILGDPRFHELGAGALVLEYHPEGAPGANPAAEAARLLTEAGYSVVVRHVKGEGTGLLWAVRSSASR